MQRQRCANVFWNWFDRRSKFRVILIEFDTWSNFTSDPSHSLCMGTLFFNSFQVIWPIDSKSMPQCLLIQAEWNTHVFFYWILVGFIFFMSKLISHWLTSVFCLWPNAHPRSKKVSLQIGTNPLQMAWNGLLNTFWRNNLGSHTLH